MPPSALSAFDMNILQDSRPSLALRKTAEPSAVARRSLAWYCACAAALLAPPADASLFQGETLDQVADVIAWVALIIGPIVVIAVFWLVHILPEKIAEQRKHPQAKAIQTLCLLSLFFGGMLWPIAWLWAYSKPVLYKMAYGTDVAEHGAHSESASEQTGSDDDPEARRLRRIKVVGIEEELPLESATNRERA
jgi:CBS domain containing-hemolysin-like protein